ncbi:hypothetical protein KsCSTR_10640 [Candidatus Kuenenia stuttgartiensis]|uniref:Uncharacterized protein n=1 Tax=Kuenenia stuttgartiensis TaxID=174633 RepID=Q1PYN0_KUEST|nr:hypothetical protein KsCSTR_10640 [Candidatus Kuenenia stuttgartiensis]CAJ72197.1 unknown protein [Candidatus Kuenenia stuttgartiensis]
MTWFRHGTVSGSYTGTSTTQLESGIYLSFVLIIEGGIESIKRLVQVTNLIII